MKFAPGRICHTAGSHEPRRTRRRRGSCRGAVVASVTMSSTAACTSGQYFTAQRGSSPPWL
jgi:hypothetical protein